MVDLMPYTDPGSLSYVGINDATNVLLAGNAAMMMNWPFMWKPAQDPGELQDRRQARRCAAPGRSGETASIDGTGRLDHRGDVEEPGSRGQADRVLSRRRGAEAPGDRHRLAADPSVRARPIPRCRRRRRTRLPCWSRRSIPTTASVTPDYTQVTTAIGAEIQKAAGSQSAKDAIQASADQVTAIVKKRS